MTAAARTTAMRQVFAVLSLELRKRFFGKRAIPVYMIALIPLMLFTGRFIAIQIFHLHQNGTIAEDRVLYAVLFRTLILRFVLYFGCVAVFVPLFRGDILDRSLHYYFLVPMKRERLTLAKYLSGLTAALVLFCGVTTATWLLLYLARGPSELIEQLTSAHGWFELLSYNLVTALAAIGYGSVSLAAGVFFKNPIVPAIVIYGWEWLNALLPAALKRISVIHYLDSLCPVSIPASSGIAILADPASPWVAVPGVVALAAALVMLAAWRVKRLEILYGVE
jgi:hypothetical protein